MIPGRFTMDRSMADHESSIKTLWSILTVIFFLFASARVFDSWCYYVKSADSRAPVEALVIFLDLWLLPLTFLLGGIAAYIVMLGREKCGYFKLCFTRLLIPFIFGTVLITAPQVYTVMKSSGYGGSYIDFYRFYFTAMPFTKVGDPSLVPPLMSYTWDPSTLWILFYLFVFAFICHPIFVWLINPKGNRFISKAASLMNRKGLAVLLSAPFVGYEVLINMDIDIYRMLHIIPFIYGYALCCDGRFTRGIYENRFPAIVLAITLTIPYIAICMSGNLAAQESTAIGTFFIEITRSFCTWFWLLALLGYGTFSLKTHKAFSEASLPLFVIHSTAVVLTAKLIIELPLNWLLQFLLIFLISFLLSLAFYSFILKPFRFLGFLFGMGLKSPQAPEGNSSCSDGR